MTFCQRLCRALLDRGVMIPVQLMAEAMKAAGISDKQANIFPQQPVSVASHLANHHSLSESVKV